jgi:Tol biopolymer transport system component
MVAGLIVFLAAGVLAHKFSEWSSPVNLGTPVNSAAFEGCPFVTRNGLSLYFGSTRPGTLGMVDIYVAQRATRSDPWGVPQNLGPMINTSFIDNCPLVTPDGHSLIFLSNRPGGIGGTDMYVAFRHDKQDDFGWEAPVPLTALNSAFIDVPGSIYEDEDTDDFVFLFASNRPGGPGSLDIYMTRISEDGSLTAPTLVTELSSAGGDQFPTVRKDGDEVILSSDRAGTMGSLDLWVATRDSVNDAWRSPENLGPIVNSPRIDQRPALSRDALTLIYASDREGNFDLFELTRTR